MLSEDAARRLLDEIKRVEDQNVAKYRLLLEKARKDVIAELAVSTKDYQLWLDRDILNAIDQRLVDLRNSLIDQLDSAMEQAEEYGQQLGAVNTPISIDPNLLKALTEYRAELVTRLSADARGILVTTIQRGLLTGKSLSGIRQDIGTVLPDSGPFSSIASRADTIMRTEFNSLLSQAQWTNMEKSAETVPDLQKKWLSSGLVNTRPAHMAVSGQVRDWDKPFIVGGEEMMRPHDPNASPGNTINCRCVIIPVVRGSKKNDKK